MRYRLKVDNKCKTLDEKSCKGNCIWRRATSPTSRIKRSASCVAGYNQSTQPISAEDVLKYPKDQIIIASRNKKGRIVYRPLSEYDEEKIFAQAIEHNIDLYKDPSYRSAIESHINNMAKKLNITIDPRLLAEPKTKYSNILRILYQIAIVLDTINLKGDPRNEAYFTSLDKPVREWISKIMRMRNVKQFESKDIEIFEDAIEDDMTNCENRLFDNVRIAYVNNLSSYFGISVPINFFRDQKLLCQVISVFKIYSRNKQPELDESFDDLDPKIRNWWTTYGITIKPEYVKKTYIL